LITDLNQSITEITAKLDKQSWCEKCSYTKSET